MVTDLHHAPEFFLTLPPERTRELLTLRRELEPHILRFISREIGYSGSEGNPARPRRSLFAQPTRTCIPVRTRVNEQLYLVLTDPSEQARSVAGQSERTARAIAGGLRPGQFEGAR